MRKTKRDVVYDLIDAERDYQDRKWGAQRDNTDLEWLAILTEEVGEVSESVLHHHFGPNKDIDRIVEELVQVIAVGVVWLEHRL